MAGDTFDAGTVYAEARLDRDEFQKELKQLRRDMAEFERSQFTIKVGLDDRDLDRGAAKAKATMKDVGSQKARPKIGADTASFMKRMLGVRATLKQIHEVVSAPLILVDIAQSMIRLAHLKYELKDLARQYIIDVVVYPVAFQEINKISNSLLSMKNIARTAIPTLFPLLGGLAGGAGAAGASIIGAAGALGVWGAVAGTMIKQQIEKGDELEKLQAKIAAADTTEERAEAQAAYNKQLADMGPVVVEGLKSISAMEGSWSRLNTAIAPGIWAVIAAAARPVDLLFQQLTPTINAVSVVMAEWVGGMERSLQGGALSKFIGYLSTTGIDSLRAWGTSLGNIGAGLTDLLIAFTPLTQQFEGGMVGMTARFAEWASTIGQNQQFQEFLAQVGLMMPDVLTILGSLIPILLELHRTFAPVTIVVLDFVAGFMTAHPEITKFLVIGFAVSQFLMGLVGILAGVVLKVVLFALIFGRVAQVMAIARTATALWSAVMLGDMTRVIALAQTLFAQIMRLTIIGRIFTAITAALRGWAIAQWLLNSALFASPITWIVLALIALGAALYLAWTYSETFRNVVTAAWEGIKTAAMWAWENGIKPALDWIMQGFQWVGDKAMWLWNNAILPAWNGVTAATQAVGQWFQWLWSTIIEPVFNFIGLAARVLLAVLVTIVLAPIILAVKAVGAIFSWLWENAIQPAFGAIGDFVSMIWNSVIKPAFDAVVGFIQGPLTTAWNWLRDSAVDTWQTISDFISTAWNGYIKPVWDFIVSMLTGIFTQAFEGWKMVVLGVWDAVSSGISAVWNFIRDSIWNPIVSFISGTLSPAFSTGSDQAVAAWEAIKGALTAVWNFLRDNVFNPIVDFVRNTVVAAFDWAVSGIKAAWDKIHGIVAAPIKFMVGVVYNEGIVPAWNWIAGIVGLGKLEKISLGFATGGIVPGYAPGVDRVAAMLSPGEGVVRPEVTRAVGPDWIQQVNHAAMRGGVSGVRRFMTMGGESSSDYKQRFASGGVAAGQAFARGEAGKPYRWGGVGPAGYDCSGFLSAVTNVILGQAAHSRRFATGSFGPGRGAGGFVPGTGSSFVIGVSPNTGSGVGHMSGNLAGLGVESRGGNGVVVGGGATSVQDGMFPWQYYLPQVGGQFVPGVGGVDIIGKLLEMWKKITDFMGRIAEFMSTGWGKGAMGLLKSMVDGAWNWLLNKASFGFLGEDTPDASRGSRGGGGTFDQGGVIPPGTSIVHNRTGRPELAGRLDQWASLIDSARIQQPGGDSVAKLDPVMMERLTGTMIEVKELLERRGAGATVNINGTQGNPIETARAAVLALRLS